MSGTIRNKCTEVGVLSGLATWALWLGIFCLIGAVVSWIVSRAKATAKSA